MVVGGIIPASPQPQPQPQPEPAPQEAGPAAPSGAGEASGGQADGGQSGGQAADTGSARRGGRRGAEMRAAGRAAEKSDQPADEPRTSAPDVQARARAQAALDDARAMALISSMATPQNNEGYLGALAGGQAAADGAPMVARYVESLGAIAVSPGPEVQAANRAV